MTGIRAIKRPIGYGLLAAAAAFAVTPLLAAPADQVRARVSNYRTLGAAFKTINDAVRSGNLRTPQVKQATVQIGNAARQQYGLFPAGSGPRPGIKTAAKPEIWSRAKEFRAAQDAFARQAAVFQKAVAGGDAGAVRFEARKLGGTCKSCHDTFRVPSD
jgi:cytochrome c556